MKSEGCNSHRWAVTSECSAEERKGWRPHPPSRLLWICSPPSSELAWVGPAFLGLLIDPSIKGEIPEGMRLLFWPSWAHLRNSWAACRHHRSLVLAASAGAAFYIRRSNASRAPFCCPPQMRKSETAWWMSSATSDQINWLCNQRLSWLNPKTRLEETENWVKHKCVWSLDVSVKTHIFQQSPQLFLRRRDATL